MVRKSRLMVVMAAVMVVSGMGFVWAGGLQGAGLKAVGEVPKKWESVGAMHGFFTEKFVEARGFGVSRMIRPEERYEMQMRSVPVEIGKEEYRVGTLQLIGILKAKEPRVYLTERDPDRKNIENVKTRELTEEEAGALKVLKEGKEKVVVGEVSKERGVPMLVAGLYAGESCMACHKDVKEGQLLGAFTYALVKVEAEKSAETQGAGTQKGK